MPPLERGTTRWDPGQYLLFAEERTRPCRDLAAQVSLESPGRVIDLGCGPGNSTQVLAERWPRADLTGIDSSAEMISAARAASPERRWIVGEIADWAAAGPPRFDLVFSNAALQWVGDHRTLYPQLLSAVAPGGAFAVQVPCNRDAPAHRIARELASSSTWRTLLPAAGVREWHVHEPSFYYDLCAPLAARIDLWETEYLHVLGGHEAILDWYRGTGLRPYLAAFSNPADRERFAAAWLNEIRNAYPLQPDGRVLFPFRRLFLIVYRAPP